MDFSQNIHLMLVSMMQMELAKEYLQPSLPPGLTLISGFPLNSQQEPELHLIVL